jgi:hypothetical protein
MKRGRLVACDAAPRCTAHSRSGAPCRKNAIKGATVCLTHGGSAPQVREAARLRLACLVAPALQALHDIIQDKTHPQRLGAIKEILERSQLYAFGFEPQTRADFQPAITVQTQVNLPEVHLPSLSDEELAKYKALLLELRELLPAEEPKTLQGNLKR